VTSWQDKASTLAAEILYPQSRWYAAVRSVPRHLLVPRWFTQDRDYEAWELRDGPSDEQAWLDAAYDGRRTLVTQIGTVHADHAEPGIAYDGWATSSATLPGLVIDMYRHARIFDSADVLDVGTGSGYGAALLAHRLGDEHVTSVDIDPHVTTAATGRLASFGAHLHVLTADATGDLPGSYDRIVPMVSMPAIPASWLAALRPGGRFVFSLTGGSVLITADKAPDGSAHGRVEYDRASFMAARHGPGYPARAGIPEHVRHGDGEDITTSPYPVVDPSWGWELDAILSVTAPGITCRSHADEQTGITTTWMTHDDGSWARATGKDTEPALVHQSGPRRLWDILDELRRHWLTHGALPLRGAKARIDPDGTCHIRQGQWQATLPAVISEARAAGDTLHR
jgi:protein-L-isoaspartate O-methyltransferase